VAVVEVLLWDVVGTDATRRRCVCDRYVFTLQDRPRWVSKIDELIRRLQTYYNSKRMENNFGGRIRNDILDIIGPLYVTTSGPTF